MTSNITIDVTDHADYFQLIEGMSRIYNKHNYMTKYLQDFHILLSTKSKLYMYYDIAPNDSNYTLVLRKLLLLERVISEVKEDTNREITINITI